MFGFSVDIQVTDSQLQQTLMQWVVDCAELNLAQPETDAELRLWSFEHFEYQRQSGLANTNGVVVFESSKNSQHEQQVLISGALDYIQFAGKNEDLTSIILRLSAHVQRMQYLHKIENLCVTDTLTGVYNRRKFDIEADRCWRQSQRQQTPCSLLLLDIDHFKLYNDTYGHLQGDECLIQVASLMKQEAVRARDIVARVGGEEFAILLPDTPREGAIHVAQRVLSAIEQANITHDHSPLGRISMSIGMACVTPDMTDKLEQWKAYADSALYGAKSKGRNQLCLTPLERMAS